LTLNTDVLHYVYLVMKLPFVTFGLVLANLGAFALELAGGGMPVCEHFGLVPAHFEATTLLTSLFLHDPDHLAHLVGNVVVLAVAGSVVEGRIGSQRLLTVYLAAGVLGGLLHAVVDPSSPSPLVGASGAIFGILAVLGAFRPRLIGFVAGFALLNIYYAFTGTGGAVSFGTHLGGLAAGALFAVLSASNEKRGIQC